MMLREIYCLITLLDFTYVTIVLFFTTFSLLSFLIVKVLKKIWKKQLIKKIRSDDLEIKSANDYLMVIIRPIPLGYIGMCLIGLKKKYLGNPSNELNKMYILAKLLINKIASEVFFVTYKLKTGRIINLLGFITFSKTKKQLNTKFIDYCNTLISLLGITDAELYKSADLFDHFNHLLKDFLMINLMPKKAISVKLSANKINDIYSSLIQLIENTFAQFSNDILFVMTLSNYKRTKRKSKKMNANNLSKSENKFRYSIGIKISYGISLEHISKEKKPLSNLFESISKLETSAKSIINHFLSYNITEKNYDYTQRIKISSFIELLLSKPIIVVETETKNLIESLIVKAINIFNTLSRVNISIPRLSIINEFASGDIFIGYQLDDNRETIPFKLRLEDIKRHIVITGPSGKGKTRLTRVIVEELLKKYSDKIKIWIFDFHGEYLDIALTHNFSIMVPGHEKTPLGINLFDPLNENTDTYVSFILRIFEESLRSIENPFSPQMERIISLAINETVLKTSNRSPKTFILNLWKWSKELIDEIPSALQSFHAIINRVRTLFTGLIGRVFWVEKSNINPQKLIKHNIIFDLSFLTRHGTLKRDLMILINTMLRYVINEIIREGYQNTDLPRIFLVIEEGRYLVPWKKKDDYSNTSTLEDIAILARKYGITLCTISQSSASISQEILENAGTFFLLGGEPPAIEKSLYQGEIEQYMHVMPPRDCIVRTTSHPALLHVRIRPVTVRRISRDKYNVIVEKSSSYLKENYQPIFPSFEEFIRSLLTSSINSSDISHIRKIHSNERAQSSLLGSKTEVQNLLYRPYYYLLNLAKKMGVNRAKVNSELIEKIISIINKDMRRHFNKRQLLEITYNLKMIHEKIKNERN